MLNKPQTVENWITCRKPRPMTQAFIRQFSQSLNVATLFALQKKKGIVNNAFLTFHKL